jgi:hypothetical protein
MFTAVEVNEWLSGQSSRLRVKLNEGLTDRVVNICYIALAQLAVKNNFPENFRSNIEISIFNEP